MTDLPNQNQYVPTLSKNNCLKGEEHYTASARQRKMENKRKPYYFTLRFRQ